MCMYVHDACMCMYVHTHIHSTKGIYIQNIFLYVGSYHILITGASEYLLSTY